MKGDAGRLAKRVAPTRQSHLGCLVLCVPARSQTALAFPVGSAAPQLPHRETPIDRKGGGWLEPRGAIPFRSSISLHLVSRVGHALSALNGEPSHPDAVANGPAFAS